MMWKTRSFIAVLLVVVGLSACAAKTPRDQARVGALTVGEAVKALDQVERDIAVAGVPGYDVAAQRKVNVGLLQVAYAARAYERAVRQWQTGTDAPTQLDAARVGLTQALDDFVQVVPQAEAIRVPLLRAIAGIRAALAVPLARADLPTPVQAQLPVLPPSVVQLFALAQLALRLLQTGRTSLERLKASLAKEGATDEELDALDADLTAIITRRESQA
jgi:hypothetical protein